MRKRVSSRNSKALNLERDFLNSLESAVKDKNSYIYQKNKYSIYTEDDFFNEDIRMFMLYVSPKTHDHHFVYSKRCQDKLFNILGIERDGYVTIDTKAMNKQLMKIRKDSCFPHILKNIKFTAHSILIDKNKVPYVVVCIQHVMHNMIPISNKAIAIPFSMINKINEPDYREIYKDNKDKLKILDIMDENDINVNEFFDVLDGKDYRISMNKMFYFNENLNLRVIKETNNRNRLKISNKLPKTVEERILKKISRRGYVRFNDMNDDILSCLSCDFGYFTKGVYVMNVEVLSFD